MEKLPKSKKLESEVTLEIVLATLLTSDIPVLTVLTTFSA